MTRTMRVDAPALRRAQPGIDAVAESAGDVLRRLAAALDAEGECWGRDEMGTAFGRAYVPASADIRTAFRDLGDGVRTVSGAISLVAARVDSAERRAQHRFG